jgi:hypothetical protein
MENYRIYFDENERNEIVGILRKYNDIIIDNIEDTSVGITIERDEGGLFYKRLMDEIDRDVFSIRTESGI